ncbi:MAG: hypothetical protein ACI9T8_000412 [Candidatus Saccharimonadales bacterium]|jgi:hypothetical protein
MYSHFNLGPEFKLPVLEDLASRLTPEQPGARCRVPVYGGSIQVGFKGKPTRFNSVNVAEGDFGLNVFVGTPMPFEGPIIRDGRIDRHRTPEIGEIQLHRLGYGWLADVTGIDGDHVQLTPVDRLVISRTLAKLGERLTR